MELPKDLSDEIWNYCRVNSIGNIDEFTVKMCKQGFTVEKFGSTPITKEVIKTVEVEKIVEKIIEVPSLPDNTSLNLLKDCTDKNNINATLISELNKTIENLRTELANEKKKKDIYGEG